jgi:hypothetical protein
MSIFKSRWLTKAKAVFRPEPKVRVNQVVLPRPLTQETSRQKGDARSEKYLCVIAIMKNETTYIKEWIDFHLAEGVAHFFLYDNDSSDEPRATLEPYIATNIATLIKWNNFAEGLSVQNLAYAHAITNFALEFEWAAFIDVDEFLFGDEYRTVAEGLDLFDNYNALRIKRYTFGPSGHVTRPDAPVIQSYTLRIPDGSADSSVKSIIRPRYMTSALTHAPTVIGNEFSYVKNSGGSNMPDLRINHYYTKSIAEFEAKFSRGWVLRNVNLPNLVQKKREKYKFDDFSHFDDRIIEISQLRKRRSPSQWFAAPPE